LDEIVFSAAAQDYLKTIYCLEKESGGVTVSRLAQALEVSAPSVTDMVKKLAARRLLAYTPYLSITLTKSGEKRALELVRHHRLVEAYLQKALSVGLDRLHEEADRLEHAISEDLEERMDLFLGRPVFDPHGSPIPDSEGRVAKRELVASDSLEPGQEAVVSQLTCRSPAQLRHLESIGLVPGAKIGLEERDTGGGVVRLRIGARRAVTIGGQLARQVLVSLRGGDPGKLPGAAKGRIRK
jgi:DtxR family Mn-dependent transcriptional regulator